MKIDFLFQICDTRKRRLILKLNLLWSTGKLTHTKLGGWKKSGPNIKVYKRKILLLAYLFQCLCLWGEERRGREREREREREDERERERFVYSLSLSFFQLFFSKDIIERLYNAVHTYTRIILPRYLVSCLYSAVWGKQQNGILNLTRRCVLISLSLNYNLVLWYELRPGVHRLSFRRAKFVRRSMFQRVDFYSDWIRILL